MSGMLTVTIPRVLAKLSRPLSADSGTGRMQNVVLVGLDVGSVGNTVGASGPGKQKGR